MTLGSGIFWSTVLILVVLGVRLISAKKKWRLVSKIVGGLILAIAAVVAGLNRWDAYQKRPRVVDELAGVRLGMTPVEVKLAKGAPDQQEDQPGDKGDLGQRWLFGTREYDEKLGVLFYGKSEDSLRVSIVCLRDSYRELLGIGRFSSEADLISKLGQPSGTSIAKDGLQKLVSFERWKVAYEIAKGQVSQICISETGSVSFVDEYKK